jgi:hypothetical protein
MSNAITTTKPLPISVLAQRPLTPLPKWVCDLGDYSVYGPNPDHPGYMACMLPEPTPEQRAAVKSLRDRTVEQVHQTPERFPELGAVLSAAIGNLMLAKPHAATSGVLWAEATTGAYLSALSDFPIWAALRAINEWKTGRAYFWDEKAKQYERYDTKWLPDAGELRELATRYTKSAHTRIDFLDRILREKTKLPAIGFARNEDRCFKALGGIAKELALEL